MKLPIAQFRIVNQLRRRMRIILFLLLLASVSGVRAQDTINLMNGQLLSGKVIGQSTMEIRYLVPRRGKLVERTEPTDGVFSVTDSLPDACSSTH